MFVLQATATTHSSDPLDYTLAVGENIDTLRAFGVEWLEDWYGVTTTWPMTEGEIHVESSVHTHISMRAYRIHVVE